MKRHFHSAFLVFLLYCRANAQLSDKIWLGGFNEFPGQATSGHYRLVFQSSGPVVVETTSLAFNFESTAAVAVDKNENLLFYSNGCEVANRNHQVMPNGNNLNSDGIADLVCPWKGYIVPQGATVLPWPGDSNRYCLLHLGANYEPQRKLRLGPLKYSVVDMTLDNGLGDVAEKGNLLIDDDLGNFAVIRHGNGRDWWILAPRYGNQVWHVFLLTPQGIVPYPSQISPFNLQPCEHYGQIAVSQAGDRIAVWGDCKARVWDFNRCGGYLNLSHELNTPAHWFYGGGAAFSPSGKFLYVTDQVSMHRADLEAINPKLDTVRFSYNPSLPVPQEAHVVPGNSFHYLQMAPNGSIYGTIASRATYFHVLRASDGPTIADVEFLPQGVPLPVMNVRSMLYYPNYHLFALNGSICDSLGIVSEVSEHQPFEKNSVRFYPNPVSDRLWVDIDGDPEMPFIYQIYNVSGVLIQSGELSGPKQSIHVQHLPQGVYCLMIRNGLFQQYGRWMKL